MRIADARITVVGAPWRELVFLEMRTDTGLVGTGEIRIVNKTSTLIACIEELAPRYVIGSDPFDVERLAWNVLRAEYGRPEEITQSALAAFDMASWDIIGQALGVPVWRLLGGRVRDRIPAYANGWYQSEREPGAIAALAKTVVARGYRAMKLDPFGAASAEIGAADLRLACDVVAAVREAVGPDVQIMIEMHGRFTPAAAVGVAAALEPYAPEWIEEPVPPENPKATRRVREATRLPVATGERAHTMEDIRPFIEDGLVDVVQVDLTHFGGFLAMKRLAGWADVYSLLLAPHNVCGPVGTMANVHFAASTPNYKVLEHFNDFADPWVQELVDAPPLVDAADGCFALPERPGLGVRLNHDACAAHPRTGGRIRLFEQGWERRGFGGGR
ncbi:MAG TPA: mandelate racemase/muconate lactonizing enzyme family protein [Vicinamibacterales bacterium]|nr:mandelate racemase/muconate lactonizing enzyme family protein [Vicinamibacterales bacterium]